MFTDDVVIHGPAPAGVLPWGGVHYGRKGAAEFFMAVGESLEVQQFELRYYTSQGNKVVVLGHERGKVKPKGRPYEIEFVHLCLYAVEDLQNSGYSMIRLPVCPLVHWISNVSTNITPKQAQLSPETLSEFEIRHLLNPTLKISK